MVVRHLLCYKKRQGGRQNASPTMYCAVDMRFARSVRIRSRQNAEIQARREGRGFCAASLLRRIRAKQKRKPDKAFNLTGLPVPCESGYVKTRRYKQDAKDKAFRRGAYSNVRDPRKTQSDNVLRSIYAFRSFRAKRLPLKRGDTSKTRRARICRREHT